MKAKIRSLRNAYTLDMYKIQKSKKSGAGVDDIYKPNVKWFPIAHRILHQVVQTRDSQSTEINVSIIKHKSCIFKIYNLIHIILIL